MVRIKRQIIIISAVGAVVLLGLGFLLFNSLSLRNIAFDASKFSNCNFPGGFFANILKTREQQIKDFGYSDCTRPDDFLVEEVENTDEVYNSFLYIKDPEDRKSFYCTNDLETARTVAEDYYSSPSSSRKKELIRTSENEKFFEFETRKISKNKSSKDYLLRYRIFKCSYISDIQGDNGNFFIIETPRREMNMEEYKEFVEILWTSDLRRGSKILGFSNENIGERFVLTVYSLDKIFDGDWFGCDHFYFFENIFSFDRDSGVINNAHRKLQEEIKGECINNEGLMWGF
jgi:hypothetical protein